MSGKSVYESLDKETEESMTGRLLSSKEDLRKEKATWAKYLY